MSALLRGTAALGFTALLAACAGAPVKLDTAADTAGVDRNAPGREVTAEACGFQLLLLIPISVNSRHERAWQSLKAQAGGKPIVDIEVEESWGYGFVGTSYCTKLRGKVVGG